MEKGYSIQTWSVRDFLAKDFIGGFELLKEMGYSGIEYAGYGGLDAKTMLKEMNRIGLRPVASHLSPAAVERDGLKAQLEYAAEVGIKYLILPCINFKTYDDVLNTAELLNKMGEEGKKYGVLAGFHNHGYEYVDSNGEYSVNYLMKETNPETVVLEQDIFWTEHAGVNHIDFLKLHSDRIQLIHLKQRGADGSNAELPNGILDIKKVIELSKSFGIDEFIVEQEQYPTNDSMHSAKVDIEYLNGLFK